MYNLLSQAEGQAYQLTVEATLDGYIPSQHDAFKNALDRYNSLFEYLRPNKIWFSRDVSEKISHFSDVLQTAIYRLKLDAMRAEGGNPNPDAWKNAWEKIHQEMPSLKSEIESEFREFLGISAKK